MGYNTSVFKNREDAGKKLAKLLKKINNKESIVLAIPRGGVLIGNEIAKRLKIPLGIIVVRKLGFPSQPEFGIGAISENNVVYLDQATIKRLDIDEKDISEIKNIEEKELIRRILLYREGKKLPPLKNKTAILVDDGLATGVSANAAIMAIKKAEPREIIFVVPVATFEAAEIIKKKVDHFYCLLCPKDLKAIGFYYKNFEQVSDEKVIELLNS